MTPELIVRIAPWRVLGETGIAVVEFWQENCFRDVDPTTVELRLGHGKDVNLDGEVVGHGVALVEAPDGAYMAFSLEGPLAETLVRVSARRLSEGRPFLASVGTRGGGATIALTWQRADAMTRNPSSRPVAFTPPPDWVVPLWDKQTLLVGVIRASVAHVALVERNAAYRGAQVVDALPATVQSPEVAA